MDDAEAEPLDAPFFEREARRTIRLPPGVEMNEAQFLQFCAINEVNKILRMERRANGDILMKTPTAVPPT